MAIKGYLLADLDLIKTSVDDYGDARYVSLTQNVPDGYVFDFQTDLRNLGFKEVGNPDGAFGRNTKDTLKKFQKVAKIEMTGVLDRRTKDEIRLWIEHGYTVIECTKKFEKVWCSYNKIRFSLSI